MLRYLKILFILSFTLLFIGCTNTTEVPSINTNKSILNSMDKDISINTNKELYFSKTKGKKYYQNSYSSYDDSWVKVDVKTNKNHIKSFDIMASPVSIKQFYKTKGNMPVTNISYTTMNDFCIQELNAVLVSSYVFDKARRDKSINEPTNNIFSEIIAPFDEEDDEMYMNEKDNIISTDGTIIKFDWESEKYYEIPNIFKSKNTTFRCMKVK